MQTRSIAERNRERNAQRRQRFLEETEAMFASRPQDLSINEFIRQDPIDFVVNRPTLRDEGGSPQGGLSLEAMNTLVAELGRQPTGRDVLDRTEQSLPERPSTIVGTALGVPFKAAGAAVSAVDSAVPFVGEGLKAVGAGALLVGKPLLKALQWFGDEIVAPIASVPGAIAYEPFKRAGDWIRVIRDPSWTPPKNKGIIALSNYVGAAFEERRQNGDAADTPTEWFATIHQGLKEFQTRQSLPYRLLTESIFDPTMYIPFGAIPGVTRTLNKLSPVPRLAGSNITGRELRVPEIKATIFGKEFKQGGGNLLKPLAPTARAKHQLITDVATDYTSTIGLQTIGGRSANFRLSTPADSFELIERIKILAGDDSGTYKSLDEFIPAMTRHRPGAPIKEEIELLQRAYRKSFYNEADGAWNWRTLTETLSNNEVPDIH